MLILIMRSVIPGTSGNPFFPSYKRHYRQEQKRWMYSKKFRKIHIFHQSQLQK